MDMPPTVFVAAGAVLAALVAGFFSFLNLVSSKENKVSEFRLAWIDGLREEIADFTAATQELAFSESLKSKEDQSGWTAKEVEDWQLKWLKETREPYQVAVTSLTKIQLRLNPQHVIDRPSSPESELMRSVSEARRLFNEEKFVDAHESCEVIRKKAALLLKSTWDLVKHGEPAYRRIRGFAQLAIATGVVVFAALGLAYAVSLLPAGS